MEAERRLHQVAHLPHRKAEGRVLELLHHAPAPEVVEVAPLRLGLLVLGFLLRQRGEVGAAFDLLQQGLGLRLDQRLVLAFGLEQDVAGPRLFGGRVLGLVVAIVLLDFARQDDRPCAQLLDVDQRVGDLAPLADAVLLFVRLEIRGDVGVGHRHLIAQAVGREDHQLGLHLLVAARELGLQFGVGDRHPLGERRSQLVDQQRLPQVVLELGLGERRVLRPQDLRVQLLAAEHAILLEGGDREDALRDLGVRDGQAQAPGFRHSGPLVDQRPQNLLVDAQLFQHLLVDAAPVRLRIGLHLALVRSSERAGRDALIAHTCDFRVVRGGSAGADEIREIQGNEGHHDEKQAPLEPVLVAAHPVEHGHGNVSPSAGRVVRLPKPQIVVAWRTYCQSRPTGR